MIDEKNLIEEIKSLRITMMGLRAGKGILHKFMEEYQKSVLKIIDEQQRLKIWIPVTEQLPPQPKDNPEFENKQIDLYLVCVNGTDYPFRAFWNGMIFTDGWSKQDVIAWMQLPEPYREEKEYE